MIDIPSLAFGYTYINSGTIKIINVYKLAGIDLIKHCECACKRKRIFRI